MRVVLDTNVLMSGIFFSGPPYEILSAWRHQKLSLVVSAEILDEYRRVGQRLSSKFPGVEVAPILALIAVHGDFVLAPSIDEQICDDPTDDMFFACAIASGCTVIVSGDKHMHKANGFGGVLVLKPREFMEKYLAM